MKEVTVSKKRAKWRRNNVEVFIMALCGVLFLAVFSYAPIRGQEKKIDFAPKDQGGYEPLDILFDMTDKAELIMSDEV